MDKEYLGDYEQREEAEYKKLLKKIQEGKFSFEEDNYPSDDRFVKLQRPVAFTTAKTAHVGNLWAQIPFCGSLILLILPMPQDVFENSYFKISEIPKIIDFIKETGKLQITLKPNLHLYQGLDYLDLFFKELNPPVLAGVPMSIFGDDKEIRKAVEMFNVLGNIRFFDYINKQFQLIDLSVLESLKETFLRDYVCLKLSFDASPLVEDIENSMIDDPEQAFHLLDICGKFIVTPISDMRSSLRNHALEETRTAKELPFVYQPEKIRFPCEIGKFLLNKLTYAPEGLDACKELMYHYDAYDLSKVQESLNEAIVTNNPDIVNKSTEELSEILDNVWNDKTIPRKIKGLQIGIPLSTAAIGSMAAGPIGAAGGFLAGLGYSVADKFIDLGTEGLSERLAKLKTKSYQANIYDFKKKYKSKIAHP